MSDKILFVDDDKNLLTGVERSFHDVFKLDTALGGEAALEKIEKSGPYAVVVSDRQMPGMDGIQFLAQARLKAPETVRIMLTGNVDLEAAVRVVNEGNIFRFLLKPASREVLGKALEDGLAQHELIIAEKELLTKTLNGSIKLLTDILAQVDPKSFGRTEKLRGMITTVGRKTPLEKVWEIHFAAMLSGIGYVTLPPETVLKSRLGKPLSAVEDKLIEAVPETSARLLGSIPRLEKVARIIRYQKKNYDGKGVPADEVRGEALPSGSRLLKILNDLAQLESTGKSLVFSLVEMQRRQGWYDPKLMESVCDAFGVCYKPLGQSAGPTGRLDSQDQPDGTLSTSAVIAAKPPVEVRAIPIKELVAGMTLGSDVRTMDGVLVLSTGHQLNEMMLERVHNFKQLSGIQEPVFVETPVI